VQPRVCRLQVVPFLPAIHFLPLNVDKLLFNGSQYSFRDLALQTKLPFPWHQVDRYHPPWRLQVKEISGWQIYKRREKSCATEGGEQPATFLFVVGRPTPNQPYGGLLTRPSVQ